MIRITKKDLLDKTKSTGAALRILEAGLLLSFFNPPQKNSKTLLMNLSGRIFKGEPYDLDGLKQTALKILKEPYVNTIGQGFVYINAQNVDRVYYFLNEKTGTLMFKWEIISRDPEETYSKLSDLKWPHSREELINLLTNEFKIDKAKIFPSDSPIL